MRETLTTAAPVQLEKIGFGEKFSYGLGDLANNIVFTAVSTFIIFFYTDVAGLAAGTVASIMLVSRLLDILTPVMGVVVDRTHSKHGKCRPWLLWMAVPFGISTVLLFTVPNFGLTGKIIYAFVTYNLAFTVIYTAINTPYGALTALISQDQYQRSLLNLYRMILAIVGMIGINAITLPLVKAFGSGPQAWQKTFMCFGVVATVLFLITFAGTKERVKPASQQEIHKTVPLKAGLTALIHNKYWVLIAVMSIFIFVNIPGLLGSTIYYARTFLGDASYVGALMAALMGATLVGMFLLAPLLKRYGKRNTALVGTLVTIVGQLLMFYAPRSLTVILVSLAIKGFGGAALMGTFYAMVADTIEYGEWKSGVRTEGLVYGASSFGSKLGTGLGAVLIGWVLGLGGYVGGSVTQSHAAEQAIKSLFLYIPLALLVGQLILLWFYHLDKEYPAIIAELQRRRAE
jgi:GPH family glycoside/pentoside/hexuronide:cation symporter